MVRGPRNKGFKLQRRISPYAKFAAMHTIPPALAYLAGKKLRGKSNGQVKKKLHQNVSNSGTSGSMSKFFYGKRRIPKAFSLTKKGLSRNYYVNNGSVRLTGGVGVQSMYSPLIMFNYTDINAINTRIAGSIPNVNRYMLYSCSAELLLTNQDLGNVRLTLYDIIARRDMDSSHSGQLTAPDYAWGNSYSDEGASNSDNLVIGSTPFSSDLFTQYFKVLKITHLDMSQGQTHTHRVHFAPNRIVDQEYIRYSPMNYKGLTCFTMIVQHGMPSNDSATKTSVSTGQTAIDMVWRKQYKYSWIADSDTNFYKSNNLASSFAVAQDIINIGAGSIAVDNVA